MLGIIVGDLIGSAHRNKVTDSKQFDTISEDSIITDYSLTLISVFNCLINSSNNKFLSDRIIKSRDEILRSYNHILPDQNYDINLPLISCLSFIPWLLNFDNLKLAKDVAIKCFKTNDLELINYIEAYIELQYLFMEDKSFKDDKIKEFLYIPGFASKYNLNISGELLEQSYNQNTFKAFLEISISNIIGSNFYIEAVRNSVINTSYPHLICPITSALAECLYKTKSDYMYDFLDETFCEHIDLMIKLSEIVEFRNKIIEDYIR